MTIQELFIINLKDYRKLRHISQLQLAEKCDSTQAYIAEIEVVKKFPSPNMIERIASALAIESYFLFAVRFNTARLAAFLKYSGSKPHSTKNFLAEQATSTMCNATTIPRGLPRGGLFKNEPVHLNGKERQLTPTQRREIADQLYFAAEKIISRYWHEFSLFQKNPCAEPQRTQRI